MLTRLQVKNYVLIDSLEIDFPEGLIIITGETGAGKSILIGALSLVMGGKADPGAITEGEDSCVVEAEFFVSGDDALKSIIEENDLDYNDGNLIIRRVINKTGRSRAFLNDSPVALPILNSLSDQLLDIHSQHQTLLLADKRFQLEILDYYAGNKELLEQAGTYYRQLTLLKSELKDLEIKLSKLELEKEYNQAQHNQLQVASLVEGELEELEIEQKQLANAEEIKTSLSQVENMLTAQNIPEALSTDSILKESEKLLNKISTYLPTSSYAERLEVCRREIDDILADINDINLKIDLSPTRLEEVDNRISLLYSLMQKHGCANIAELIEVREKYAGSLLDSTLLEEKKAELEKQISELQNRMNQTADQLHKSRLQSKDKFAESICTTLKNMELEYAVFEVDLEKVNLSATGYDNVVFKFSASGKNAIELSKCASGGEMSRIMLALKAMMAKYAAMPTMIFDEIDAGVSGSVADKMGSLICDMGKYMQVFAITHLPQVAAKGSAHYLVSKTIDKNTGQSSSTIKKLSAEQRVYEVARMLSGSVLTDAAIANAKELLQS